MRGYELMTCAWVLLVVRILPAAASIAFVATMFLPAHWVLEPRETAETVGFAWYGLAAVGAALLVSRSRRAIAVAGASRRTTVTSRAYRDAANAYEVDDYAGVSLAGVFRPRILIGQGVKNELSRAELDVAIAHEVAHRNAFDNLARWCMVCAPDFLAGSRVAARLEHAWHVAAESRADADAVAGDRARAVHLASALIKVARLSAIPADKTPVPFWSTLNDCELLERRVHRLLTGPLPQRPQFLQLGTIAALVTVGLLILSPAVGESVHRLTEGLVALLP
jgi:beta-lactamase regulating signal transducer with metallopeptidase domain